MPSTNPKKVDARGHDGIYQRYRDLNLESFQDFIIGVRQFTNVNVLVKLAHERAGILLRDNGFDPHTVPLEKAMALFETDPQINVWGRAYMDGQYFKFLGMNQECNNNADLYLSEMEAADRVGPGALELNPDKPLPDYAKHEIHTQLGGYCGNAFAGYLYFYGTQIEYVGANRQDAVHGKAASRIPVPADNQVKRILDYGTGCGQLATELKKRFPNAEIWGCDAGGPMVRFAHMRANDIGSNVNFRQALAEDSGFPDNYFDIVTSNIVHHETPADSSAMIFKEVQRILRPGGVYYPMDIYTAGPPPTDAIRRFRSWWNWRWNHEDWQMEWWHMDSRKAMRDVGLKLITPPAKDGVENNIVATKA